MINFVQFFYNISFHFYCHSKNVPSKKFKIERHKWFSKIDFFWWKRVKKGCELNTQIACRFIVGHHAARSLIGLQDQAWLPDMADEKEEQTFLQKLLFYTTAFFILLGTFSLFAFLFLVPFVIDPAFTTIFMEFDTRPALCVTIDVESRRGEHVHYLQTLCSRI